MRISISEAFDSIMKGLEEVKAHRDGKINLKQHTIRIAPVPDFTSTKVRSIRNKLKLTQPAFAAIFSVSKENSGSLGVWA